MKELVSNNVSLSNESIFEQVAKDWNTSKVSIESCIYPKMPVHFAKYVKQWKKNQDRRDAEIASGSNRLCNVLERVSNTVPPPSLEHA